MDQIIAILRVKGGIPRRAVVQADGRLADKTSLPDAPEVDLVSRLCEVARAAGGQACYPRQTAALLDRALADNDPGAWQAVRDDIVTGDLDIEACLAVLAHGSNSAALVGCLVGARSAKHLLHVCCLLARVMEGLREETRAEMGRALACQMRPLLDTLLQHGADMSLDVRDAAYDGMARILAGAALPDSRVADAVLHALERRREELLRVFLGVPAAFVEHRPQILPMLLGRLSKTVSASRYPCLELLARLLEHDGSAVAGAESAVVDAVACCLAASEDRLDSRACLAASRILACLGGGRLVCAHEGLCAMLVRALQRTSKHLVSMA